MMFKKRIQYAGSGLKGEVVCRSSGLAATELSIDASVAYACCLFPSPGTHRITNKP